MRLQKFVTTSARPSRDNANSLATARDERERDVMNEGRV